MIELCAKLSEGFWIGLACGLLLSLPGFLLAFRRFFRKKYQEIEDLKEVHRKEFEKLIDKVNHEGQIPIASTAQGLTGLISLGISRCLDSLKKLQDAQDWKTHIISEELSGIRGVELVLLYKKLQTLIDQIRSTLTENNFRQEHENRDDKESVSTRKEIQP